jgi:hypothetical protein
MVQCLRESNDHIGVDRLFTAFIQTSRIQYSRHNSTYTATSVSSNLVSFRLDIFSSFDLFSGPTLFILRIMRKQNTEMNRGGTANRRSKTPLVQQGTTPKRSTSGHTSMQMCSSFAMCWKTDITRSAALAVQAVRLTTCGRIQCTYGEKR